MVSVKYYLNIKYLNAEIRGTLNTSGIWNAQIQPFIGAIHSETMYT